MPVIAENVAERLVLKAHSTGTYDPTTEPVPATDPAATGGQIIRFVDHNLALTRQNYSSNEMREDQQQPIENLGTKSVPVTVNALLSCSSHKIMMEAVLRGTWSAAAVSKTETELTSVAADNATSKYTFGGGDPVSEGLKVGMIVQFSTLSEALNNATNYLILGFSGTSNRVMEVYPAPTDMTADIAFTVASVGRYLYAPSSSPVRRKFALETHNSDSDLAKLYTEIAFGGMTINAAPNQNVRLGFTGMGRNRYLYTGASAPFFTSPTAAPTTDLIASMDGLLRLNGATVGYMTGLDVSFAAQLSALAQIKSDGLAAGIVPQGNRVIGGSFTLFELDTTFHDLYDAETEFSIMAYMPATSAVDAPAVVVFLPRVKITNQTVITVDGAKALQCTFSAARYAGSAPGVESTSLFIHDTVVA